MFSYEPLWETAKLKGITKKTDLIDIANISPTTLSKLSKNERVNMETLEKLCEALQCDVSSILTFKFPTDKEEKKEKSSKKVLRLVSLFSGIGGFEAGIVQSKLASELVFSSEIDIHAAKSYVANFPKDDLYGDITKVSVEEIPDHDLLVAGFPCQAFSIAGKREGFEDETRGTLFFDIARILKAKRPKYILLENVKNLISHDRSRTIQVILESLADLGYALDFTVINSSEAGLPQSRDRTYIIGILDHDRSIYTTDFRNKRINNLKSELNIFGFNSFNFFDSLEFNNPSVYLEDILEERVEDKYYFNSKEMAAFLGSKKVKEYKIEENKKKIIKLFDIPREVLNDNERQRRVYSTKGLSPTLLARSDTTKILIKEGNTLKIRKLTPVENMRAQGFEKEFIEQIKATNVSDTQLYKQSGNAVSPPVITGIINHLHRLMDKDD